MKLEGLRQLCRDMRKNNVTKTQFEFKINQVTFDVAFFINKSPYQLLFGAKNHKCSFFVNVKNGFEISPIITPSSAYKDLCTALSLKYDPENPFSPKKFYAEFANKIPNQIQSKNSRSIPKLTQSITDLNDFGVFSHWKIHSIQHVKTKNLIKTEKAFGREVMEFCKNQNVSSCWKTTKQ
ncbi:DUF6037 family protein [Providencia sp. PROV196]|uniref:DUF6037 family protein n=1 Tax=Providencia sp. PROV196 TaxID=2949897 RepID=UPI00234943D2|nr:DUF6037 family protein [Providencia sp. PROV196]